MFERVEDYETVASLGFALLFVLWEQLRPARAIDRRRQLGRDFLALGVLILIVNTARPALGALYRAVDLRGLLADSLPWRDWPLAAQMALALVIADFSLYWAHRLLHTRACWPAHRFHHSVEELYWFSGIRTSLGHGLLYAVPQVLVASVLFDFSVAQLGGLFSAGVFVQYFTHANINVPLGPLGWILVSPQVHRRHHARRPADRRHGNYATFFIIWDRLFGTYVPPVAEEPLGLDEERSLARMIVGV